MLRVFEAFAGVGSQRMALRNIGIDFEVVGISDVDRYALLAYDAIHHNGEYVEEKTEEEMLEEFRKRNIAYNFSTGKSELPKRYEDIKKLYEAHVRSKNYGDIRTIDVNELPDMDLFTYSFPCKNISVAGKQAGFEEGSETQSSLVWECRRIIKFKKPKYLLMENVKNLVGKKHKPFFDLWCHELENMGYINYWKVLNGHDFEVPQNRERVIMVSIYQDVNDKYEIPTITDNTKHFIDILEPSVEDKYFVTNPDYQDYIHKIISLSDCNIKNKTVRLGGLFDTQTTRRQAGAIWDKYGIAPTLDTCQGGYRQPLVIDGNRIRKITPKEAWRLQGFSDEDFEKAKNAGLSNSKLYERAGRGIVVPMLEEIFKNLFK